MIRVFAVHTALAMVEPVTQLFKEHLPDVRLNHIVDDSLIQEVIEFNRVTPAVAKRLVDCYHMAVDARADIIFNTCSSIGEIAQGSMARMAGKLSEVSGKPVLSSPLSGVLGVKKYIETNM